LQYYCLCRLEFNMLGPQQGSEEVYEFHSTLNLETEYVERFVQQPRGGGTKPYFSVGRLQFVV
jgi:hypothetical protein